MWRQSGSSGGCSGWSEHMTGLQSGGHLELGGGNQMRIVLRCQFRRRVDVRRQCLDIRQSWLALRRLWRRWRWTAWAHGEGAYQAGRWHAGQHEGIGTASCRMHQTWLRVAGRLLLLLLGRRVVRTADQQCGRGGGLRRLRRDGLGRRVRRLYALCGILALLGADGGGRTFALQRDRHGRGGQLAQRREARLQRAETAGNGGIVMQTLQQLLYIMM